MQQPQLKNAYFMRLWHNYPLKKEPLKTQTLIRANN